MSDQSNDNAAHNAEHEGRSYDPAHDWRNTLSGIFHDLFAGSWLQNIVCSIAIGLILLLVAYFLNRTLRGVMFGAGVGITIILWIVWLTFMERVAPFKANTSTALPPNELDQPLPSPLNTPMKDDRPNINITSHDQKGGFTGINQGGTVNLGPPPPVPIAFHNDKVELLKSFLGAPTIEAIEFVRYSNPESEDLYNKLRYAFGSWRIPTLNIAETTIPPLEAGVTVRYDDQKFAERADAIVKALQGAGLPARKLDNQSTGGKVVIEVNGLSK
jgi:hypothetical protein